MLVEELIEELKKLPAKMQVVLSEDGEGNDFSPLAAFSVGMYMPETTWCGCFMDNLDFIEEGYTAEDGVPSICLWPTN